MARQIGNSGGLTTRTFLHDFEPTIHPFIREDPAHLLGLLNFAVLWHEEIFLNDTALGDNPHLLHSYWDPTAVPLFHSFQELVLAGTLKCLLRDKVSIGHEVLVDANPTPSEIFEGWQRRDAGNEERFLTQVFGERRDIYNSTVDRLLDRYPAAVVRYDPDTTKPAFRSLIRAQLTPGSDLMEVLERLPRGLVERYVATCSENEYFTNADIWELVRTSSTEANQAHARDLVLMQGHLNQQCVADVVSAGLTGSDHTQISLDRFNRRALYEMDDARTVHGPFAFDDLVEPADVQLSAPPLELLSLLSPEQVLDLRESAGSEYFSVQRSTYADIEQYRGAVLAAVEAYWRTVCEAIERLFPANAWQKSRLAIHAEAVGSSRPDPMKRFRRGLAHLGETALQLTLWTSPIVMGFDPEAGRLMAMTGAAHKASREAMKLPAAQRLAVPLWYERTEAASQLRATMPGIWAPGDTWATDPRVKSLGTPAVS